MRPERYEDLALECLLQTSLDLLRHGVDVHVSADATCSRARGNWEIGLRLLDRAGAVVTTTEIVVFQLLGRSATREFKAMLPHLK